MTAFSITWDNEGAAGSYANPLMLTAQYAAAQWASYIQGAGTIDVKLTIGDTGSSIAYGAANFAGRNGSLNTIAALEAQTGTDYNGADWDIQITVSPNYLTRFYYDTSASPSVPANQVDAVSVFLHELGHGLAFLDVPSSVYAQNVRSDATGTYFVGQNATKAYGGAAPLQSDGSHTAFADLMYPSIQNGTRAAISAFDLGVLQDVGYSVRSTGAGAGLNAIYRYYDLNTGAHFYTQSAGEKAFVDANIPNYQYEGVRWSTPNKGQNTQDVYRFYDLNTTDHYYTSSATERDFILGHIPNYQYEGVAFQAYKDASAPGSLVLEKFYDLSSTFHHFSATPEETAGLRAGISGPGWRDEGAGFIVSMPT